jgi:hypothetical protein
MEHYSVMTPEWNSIPYRGQNGTVSKNRHILFTRQSL